MNSTKLNQIIEGCRRSDRVSQHALYELYYSFALSVGRRYVASTDAAREVVNDAFFRVFTKIENYDSAHPFQAWLRKVVVFSAIDHYRKYQQSSLPIEELSVADQTAHDDCDVLERLSSDELLANVQQLPPSYRLAINLFAIEGYEHHEIASMLNISVGASKSNLFKARAKLKAMMHNTAPKTSNT
ncbi:MAG: RNA polymerase sigma factor [Saprospiraceae bacterium]|nr:RNA polymerase sigma factor [Saprospiraceae bacterium]